MPGLELPVRGEPRHMWFSPETAGCPTTSR